MSKSIKDYREAMDSVKISESFYKRTEDLLSELPETKLTSAPPKRRWLPTVLTAAAACFICVFGIRLVNSSGSRISDIETETVTVTVTVTEAAQPEITSPATAAPLLDAPAEEDDLDKIITGAEEAAKEKEEKDKNEREKAEKNKQQEKTSKKEKDGPNTAALGNASPETAAAALPPPPDEASAKNVKDDTNYAEAGASDEYEEEENEEAAGGEEPVYGQQYEETGFASAKLLPDGTDYSRINVTITPYFTMDSIKSGKTKVNISGSDCKDITDFISDAVSRSPETEAVSDPTAAKLKFRLVISETEAKKTLYNIQLSENGILTADSSDGTKKVYALSSADSEVLEHILFLRFAAEDDYEKYLALK